METSKTRGKTTGLIRWGSGQRGDPALSGRGYNVLGGDRGTGFPSARGRRWGMPWSTGAEDSGLRDPMPRGKPADPPAGTQGPGGPGASGSGGGHQSGLLPPGGGVALRTCARLAPKLVTERTNSGQVGSKRTLRAR